MSELWERVQALEERTAEDWVKVKKDHLRPVKKALAAADELHQALTMMRIARTWTAAWTEEKSERAVGHLALLRAGGKVFMEVLSALWDDHQGEALLHQVHTNTGTFVFWDLFGPKAKAMAREIHAPAERSWEEIPVKEILSGGSLGGPYKKEGHREGGVD